VQFVILSGGIVREASDAEVEGPRVRVQWHWRCQAFSLRPARAAGRMPCIVLAASGSLGVLRLRGSCASRRSHCAQDDSIDLWRALAWRRAAAHRPRTWFM